MIRPLLSYYGGNTRLARRIAACFLPHRTYVETHAGGLSVLLAKRPAPIEVANDRDPGLMNLYEVAVGETEEFCSRLRMLPHDEETFEAARRWRDEGDTPLLRAVGFLVRNRWSFGSTDRTFMIDRMGPGGRDWLPFVGRIPQTARRLKDVRFRCEDAIAVIRRYDAPGVLFYVDPPYLNETRSADRHYVFEMTAREHEQLLDVLDSCEGTVYLSGYRSGLYDERLRFWERIEWAVTSLMSGKPGAGRGRTDCLWAKGRAGAYMLSQYLP